MKDPSPNQQLLEALASRGISDEEVQELRQQVQSQSPAKLFCQKPREGGAAVVQGRLAVVIV